MLCVWARIHAQYGDKLLSKLTSLSIPVIPKPTKPRTAGKHAQEVVVENDENGIAANGSGKRRRTSSPTTPTVASSSQSQQSVMVQLEHSTPVNHSAPAAWNKLPSAKILQILKSLVTFGNSVVYPLLLPVLRWWCPNSQSDYVCHHNKATTKSQQLDIDIII